MACVQGNPFDHCPDLWQFLERPFDSYLPLGCEWLVALGDGSPHHPGLPIQAMYERWLGRRWPGQVMFAAGGMFAVKGRTVRRWPARWYRDRQHEMSAGELPWVMERLWGPVFGEVG